MKIFYVLKDRCIWRCDEEYVIRGIYDNWDMAWNEYKNLASYLISYYEPQNGEDLTERKTEQDRISNLIADGYSEDACYMFKDETGKNIHCIKIIAYIGNSEFIEEEY